MRTIAPVLMIIVIGVSGSMIGLSGFNEVWGAPTPDTSAAQEQVDRVSEQANPNNNGSIKGPVTSGESSIVGLISDAAFSITDFAGSVALFPVTLMNLGFPAWFALPLGSVAYLLAGIGVMQFTTNREWR